MKKIAIITAMQEEAEHIIQKYNLKLSKKMEYTSFYENEHIVLALAGIGKIQACFATTYIFAHYEVEKVINIGIAGSLLWNKASIGDVFLVGKISQHDMYLPFDGAHLDYAKKEIVFGKNYSLDKNFSFQVKENAYCLTWDQFIDDAQKVQKLWEIYGADVIEMEAFAIASVVREYGALDRFICIKAISDGADNEAQDAHMGNLDFAMQNSLQVLESILK